MKGAAAKPNIEEEQMKGEKNKGENRGETDNEDCVIVEEEEYHFTTDSESNSDRRGHKREKPKILKNSDSEEERSKAKRNKEEEQYICTRGCKEEDPKAQCECDCKICIDHKLKKYLDRTKKKDRCTEHCKEEMPRRWCNKCKHRELQEYRNFKDYNFKAPDDPSALDWCVKTGLKKEIPSAQGQIHKDDIRRFRLFKRKNRYLHCDDRIVRRREGQQVDDAFNSYLDRRDPEGDLHIARWCPKLNPVFCKTTNNFFRCACDRQTPTGTVRQFVLHSIQNHSHIQGRQVECLECAAQGTRQKFLSPQSLWRHINNCHEKVLMCGHLKVNINPEHQSNNDTDRWLNSYSQLVVACVLETLHNEGSLNDSFFRRERKEEDLGGARPIYQQRGPSEEQENPNERRVSYRNETQ